MAKSYSVHAYATAELDRQIPSVALVYDDDDDDDDDAKLDAVAR